MAVSSTHITGYVLKTQTKSPKQVHNALCAQTERPIPNGLLSAVGEIVSFVPELLWYSPRPPFHAAMFFNFTVLNRSKLIGLLNNTRTGLQTTLIPGRVSPFLNRNFHVIYPITYHICLSRYTVRIVRIEL